MLSISIIGIGRMGGALALALARAGYRIDTLVHRNPSAAKAVAAHISQNTALCSPQQDIKIGSDIVFITTADPDIGAAAEWLLPRLTRPAVVFHCSGSLSSDVLSVVKNFGCSVGSLHPLISVSDPFIGSERFAGAYFCMEGDQKAVTEGKTVVQALRGRSFLLGSESKALYHAAAVTACGHLVALVDAAVEMLSACGLEPGEAKEILTPLIRTTVENLAAQSIEDALTGSFARGDAAAVSRHLAAFEGTVSRGAKEIYLELGERSAEIAERKGASSAALAEIRSLISIAKKRSGC